MDEVARVPAISESSPVRGFGVREKGWAVRTLGEARRRDVHGIEVKKA